MESTEVPIKSIELQLVRVETCGCAEGYARDGSCFFVLYTNIHLYIYLNNELIV